MVSQVLLNRLNKTSYIAVLFLFLFVFLSFSLTAGYHILVIVPSLYYFYHYIKKGKWQLWSSETSLLIFALLAVVSVIANREDMGGLQNILKIKYLLIGAISVPAMTELVKNYLNEKRVKVLLNVFFVSTTIANLVGLYALVTGYNPLRMKAACHHGQACGMYGMTITYGYGVELLSLLFLGLFVYRKELSKYLNIKLLIIALIVSLLGLYFSFSRGALLGFIVAAPLLYYGKNKALMKKLIAASLAMVVILVSLIALNTGSSTFLSRYLLDFKDESNMERVGQFKAAIYGFKEKPVWGLGFRNFEPHSLRLKKKYGGWDKYDFVGHAHNNFLEMLAGCGIIAFIFFLIFHFMTFKEILAFKHPAASIYLAFFFGFTFSGLFQSTIIDGENMFLIMGTYAIFRGLQRGLYE